MALLIRSAYVLHDQTTGFMILEEMAEKARYSVKMEEIPEIAQEGTRLGNPRLWLGEYRITLEGKDGKIQGRADAGSWSGEIELGRFQPAELIRKYRAVKELAAAAENAGRADGDGS